VRIKKTSYYAKTRTTTALVRMRRINTAPAHLYRKT